MKKRIYLCSDLIVEIWYSDESWYPILKSVFELYLRHQKRDAAPVTGFVFSVRL